MSKPNATYPRTPWWEHAPTTSTPCEQPTTTSTAPLPTTTTALVPATTQPQTTTSTTAPAPTTTTTEQAPEPTTTAVATPLPQATTVGQPEPTTVAVSTPLPADVDAVVLAPPVSHYAVPVLPHTGVDTTQACAVGGALLAVGLICTALATRLNRKAQR